MSGSVGADHPSTQYANIAPLPGAGIAFDPRGEPDGFGAVQANIPIAYTPGAGQSSLGIYGGSHIGEFSPKLPNGSGSFSAGFGTSLRVYFSAMQVSSLLFEDSKALSVQVQLAEETAKTPALALGCQDLLNKEKQTGASRAWYFVATRSVVLSDRNLYVTVGYGGGRFLHRPFAGVSVPLSGSLNAAVEYDGFQVNEALAWRPGGRFGAVTILAGYNNRCGALLGAGATGRIPTALQLAIGAVLIASKE
ncbi:MAG: YjbH domain-containing protein [Armatimonadota bacterium]